MDALGCSILEGKREREPDYICIIHEERGTGSVFSHGMNLISNNVKVLSLGDVELYVSWLTIPDDI